MARESLTTPECPTEAVFVELIEGRFDQAAVAKLQTHIEACTGCRALVDDLTMGALGPTEMEIDEGIARALLAGASTAILPASLDPTAPALGQIVGGSYRLVRLIGAGGMGAVYEAEHTGTEERVAVKLISGRLLAARGDAPSRFRREARAAGAIESPHIVRIVDSGADEVTGHGYLVMEYLRGEDLQQLIDRAGPLRPDAALRIAAQALVGLAQAHAAGIVHRDIKPANLFLAHGPDGEVTVKLLDFGIAKIGPEPSSLPFTTGLTRTGALLGSPLYMSPEQVQSSKDVDHRTDLWSLGSLLYAALSGRAPHRDVDSVGKLILAICGSPAPPIRERAPWVVDPVAQVLVRALAIDREARYPSAAAMLDALRPLIQGDLSLREKMLVGVTPEERATIPAPPPRDTVGDHAEARRGRGGRLAAGAAVALGIAILAMLGIDHARPPAAAIAGTPAAAAPPATSPAEGTSAPQDAPIRRVLLVVFPADVAVEIDGVRAVVREGAVELAGALGSEHRVRASKGESAVVASVVVTESGAVPPKVELPPRRPPATGPKPPADHAPASAAPQTPGPRDEDVMRKPE